MRFRFVPSQRLVSIVLLSVPVLAAGLLALTIALYVRTQDRLEASDSRLEASETTTAALADQLRSMGVEPEVDVDEVDEGAPVLIPGPRGEPGEDGSDGRDGVDGRGVQGQRGLPGASGPRGPRGPSGPAGETGSDGQSVTGPAGPQGTAGPQGEPGQQGPAGEPGKDGSDGAPGTATPGTYTCEPGTRMAGFTVAADGGVTLDCRGPLDP